MRFFLRLILVWVVIVPVAIYFGFPRLTAYLQEKTRADVYSQCLTQTAEQPDVFDPANPAIAEQYCQCVRDGITLTRDDMKQLLRKEHPAGMQGRLDAQMNACTQRLAKPAAADAQVIHF